MEAREEIWFYRGASVLTSDINDMNEATILERVNDLKCHPGLHKPRELEDLKNELTEFKMGDLRDVPTNEGEQAMGRHRVPAAHRRMLERIGTLIVDPHGLEAAVRAHRGD